jgi:hypothetical protein
MSFALQSLFDRPRAFGGGLLFPGAGLPLNVIARGLLAGAVRRLAFLRRRQRHSGAPRLREADRNGLLGRTGAVFTLADVLNLFPDEFPGLGARRLALTGIFLCSFDGFLLRHDEFQQSKIVATVRKCILKEMGKTFLAGIALLVSIARAQGPAPVYINAPYVTTPDHVVTAMLKLAGVGSSDTVYDLGCGDGRIVISAAKEFGARGTGIDNSPARIEEARANAQKAGVEALVKFEVNDFFDADIHNATVVMLYLLPDVNLRLKPKLLKELRPGARVVSHSFHMGDWKPDKDEVVDGSHIYLWTIPAK